MHVKMQGDVSLAYRIITLAEFHLLFAGKLDSQASGFTFLLRHNQVHQYQHLTLA